MRNFGVFFKRFFSFIICYLLCISVGAVPTLSAKSAILINADTGEVILEYNADERLGMASTTKIMTAIIAIESEKLDNTFTIPNEATGIEGSSLYLKSGESLTLRELVTGLMLQSANDAAEAIAIIVGGNVDSFVDMMNKKSLDWGLKNTHFANPHGLASDDHYTTARELAIIASYAIKNKSFQEICSMRTASIPGTDYTRHITNHNKMLTIYEGAYGIKTGFTKATGRCLVSAARRNGVNLIAVTLNAPNDWKDHKLLLDYGFSSIECVDLAFSGQLISSIPIFGGTLNSTSVYIKNDVSVYLKKNRNSIVEKIEINHPQFAPVYQGDEVGRIVFYLDGLEIASSPLCASTYIGTPQKNKSFFEKIFS